MVAIMVALPFHSYLGYRSQIGALYIKLKQVVREAARPDMSKFCLYAVAVQCAAACLKWVIMALFA